jgi:hypothetical protein
MSPHAGNSIEPISPQDDGKLWKKRVALTSLPGGPNLLEQAGKKAFQADDWSRVLEIVSIRQVAGAGHVPDAQLSVIADNNSLCGGLNIQKRELGVKGILVSRIFTAISIRLSTGESPCPRNEKKSAHI